MRDNGVAPTTLSLGRNLESEFREAVHVSQCIDSNGRFCDSLMGMKIKWVKKSGHVRCLPMPKKYRCVFT